MLKLVRIKMNSEHGSQDTESGFPLPSDTITAMDDNDNRIIMFPWDFYQKNEIENGWKDENYGHVTDCIIFGPNQVPYMFPVPVKDLEIIGKMDLLPATPKTETNIGVDFGNGKDYSELITMLQKDGKQIIVGREVWDKMQSDNKFNQDTITSMIEAMKYMKGAH